MAILSFFFSLSSQSVTDYQIHQISLWFGLQVPLIHDVMAPIAGLLFFFLVWMGVQTTATSRCTTTLRPVSLFTWLGNFSAV